MTTVAFRTCPLCEATCGLAITLEDGAVVSVRGDDEDVFSHGFICPKGVSIDAIHRDPDRLRTPLIRRDGALEPATWDEAFALIGERIGAIIGSSGRDAIGVYLGNPNVHNYGASLYIPVLLRALGTRTRFTAATVDQMPKQVASGLLFGTEVTIAVPDVDRTDYLLCLGANPMVSNGSLLTAPDMPGRLKALRARGGRLVVVDPRRSRTAEVADEHLPIRPASDAFWLAALATTLFEEDLVDLGDVAPHVSGTDEVRAALAPFTAEAVAPLTGIEPATTRRIARELAAAPSAAVYGRIGTTTTRFGTLASWLVDVVNTLTGNLDRPGGVLFPRPATGSPNTRGESGRGRGVRIPGSGRTKVRGASSVFGELPVATLAEEIEGGHVRAMIVIAGNPVLTAPNSARLDAAFASLDFQVSLDLYVNETSRHADVVLPVPSPLERGHYDLQFTYLSVRDIANYSPPVLPLPDGALSEPDILLRMACAIAGGEATPDALDDLTAAALAHELSSDADGLLADVRGRPREQRLLDILLRTGPYELTLDELEAHPHGIDLGALRPRIPEVLRTPSGTVELAAPQLLDDLSRLVAALDTAPDGFVLVGRRHLRSNNSWMHNVEPLVKGRDRCTLQVHPDDATRIGLVDAGKARVRSRVGEVIAPVEVTDTVMPGVVSLPFGWGHDLPGTQLATARAHAGVNSNVLTDDLPLDPLSGTAQLNGIPVEVRAV